MKIRNSFIAQPLILALTLILLLMSSCTPRELVKMTLIKEIDEHITWKVIQTPDMNGAPASINILDIDMKEFDGELVLAWYKNELVPTTKIVEEHEGFAGINGSFFDMRVGGSVLYLQEDGVKIADAHDESKFVNSGAYAVDTNGVVMILKRDGDWEYSPAYDDIMVSGPIMIHNDEYCELDSIRFNMHRHPRTAIGITDDYHILLVTVDGRHAEAAGMSMWELRDFMDKLGCKDALNFDGGGSTTMVITGQSENNVVNYPSDNKKYDHFGERKVANALIVVK